MSSAPTESVPTVDVPVSLENVGQCHPHQHEVQFYFDDRFLVRSLAEYVSNALDAGGSAVIVATQAHRESLAKELERAGIDLGAATAEGRFVLLDAAATLAKFMVDGSPEEAPFRECVGTIIALAAGAARPDCNKVVVFGEMVTLLLQRSDAASVVRLEQFWNRLCEVHSFRLRCGYPLASFDRQIHTELFSQICGEHHMVIPAESYTDLSDENERRRTVARLQQTEQVLKTEAVERRTAQAQKQRIENENMQLMEEIRKREAAEDELRRFTRRLLSARDEEQRRIAGELHENTAQLLAALSLYFGVLHEEKGSLNPKLASVVASSRLVSDNLLREIRKLSHLLHPPTLDDMGLGSALLEYVEQRRASSKARIELDIAEDLGRFPRKLEIAVFRIIEEALAGILANCEDVLAIVHLTRSTSALEIRIENRRTGTYSAAESSSRADTRIMGIHERAQEFGGSVQFSSDPTGTVLRVILPLAAQKPTHA